MDTLATQRLAANYLAALRRYLKDEVPTDFRLAHEFGSQTAVNDMEVLGLARIHDAAFEALPPPAACLPERELLAIQASKFFTEAILPIENTHPSALDARVELDQTTDQLEQHTLALEDSNREILQHLTTRQHAEAALKTSEKSAREEQAESLLLEQQLQEIVQKHLCANEEQRTKTSQVLQHEVAQALIAIKIKLLALESRVSAKQLSLSQEINTTHWLVEASAQTLSNLIREFSSHHA